MTTAPASRLDLTADQLRAHPAMQKPWYYSIELLPGFYTDGRGHRNVALTRRLIRNTGVEGHTCIDLGIVEGLVTSVLAKRGAASVVGYDRLTQWRDRVSLVKAAMGVDFDHITGISLAELPATLRQTQRDVADIVVFSGVLYHMVDPMAGIAIARGMVRNGGILILETSGILGPEMGMFFNAEGRFNDKDGTTFWLATAPCLEYMLRLYRLRPIDCAYIKNSRPPTGGRQVGRIAIACRAVDECVAAADDAWMPLPRKLDFEQFLDWKRLASDRPPVPYTSDNPDLVLRPDTGTVDVWKTISTTPECPSPPEMVRLALGAAS